MENSELQEVNTDDDIELPDGSPPLPPLDSMLSCSIGIPDTSAVQKSETVEDFLIEFREEDFVHQ